MENIEKRTTHEKSKRGSEMTRRDFLKKTAARGVIAVSAGAIVTDQAIHNFNKRALILRMLKGEREISTPQIEEAKGYLKETYGVEIAFGDAWSDRRSTIDPLNAEESAETLRYLVEEMGKYPPDFFVLNKISTIRIGKNINLLEKVEHVETEGNIPVGGYARRGERSMVLNYFVEDTDFFRGAFHHELYHILDFWDSESSDNNRWEQIHADCTCSPSVHRQKFDPSRKEFDSSFVTMYGESKPQEERAEFARMMMVPQTHAAFLSRLRTENENSRNALKRKYDAIKKDFYKWSNGQMDEKYWEVVVKKARSDDTFEDISYGADHGGDEYGTYSFDDYHK